jgi:hypothetical protein
MQQVYYSSQQYFVIKKENDALNAAIIIQKELTLVKIFWISVMQKYWH